ncbi:MAG: hypothetical protein Unbinned1606contig1000_1 [Prokaryotic dsDNA virus sp.]|nr:MAG: hypothetical protein Unbinned1606contig1000_1 [Prokaryotic dsDNA virus sp.]
MRCSTNSFVTPQYELQLIAVGMLLAKPSLLDSVAPEDFADSELNALVGMLKVLDNGERKGELRSWLNNKGCKYDGNAVETVLDRVKLDGKYGKALHFITRMSELAEDGSEKGKREFVRALVNAKQLLGFE